ncbi:MAG: cofactor-independent phosphoglycerate mutase [Phycisphaerae bacterium]
MKYVILIPDGAADEPCPALDGKTPLQAAALPALDKLAAMGRLGTAVTIPPDSPPAGETALLSVLGYDPRQFRAARGPMEARARGVRLGRDDLALRCNLVTLADDTLLDFTAGAIRSAEAARLIDAIRPALADERMELHAGESYRHVLVWRDAATQTRISTTDPQELLGEPIRKGLPRGKGSDALRQVMARAADLLRDHDVNAVRDELGESPANAIWLWGEGVTPGLPRFSTRFGVRGAMVSGIDYLRGLADLLGFHVVREPGITGMLDTNFAAQGRAAVAALDSYNLVCVHVEAPDEAGHQGDAVGKVRVLEAIDREIATPLAARLSGEEAWRMLVIVDHATPVSRRRHTSAPTPFALAGSDIASNRGEAFDEATAEQGELHVERASDLMEYFLRR